jgi:4-methylaminobutanoate oxidase (formaldehyde-forming)
MQQRAEEGAVEIRDVTEDFACFGLWGPRARDLLAAVSDSNVSNGANPYMTARTIQVHGFEILAQRVTYVGELGWELYVPRERAEPVWDALIEAGPPFGLETGGYKVLDSLRLEKGYRYYGMDVTPLENPYEAGLGFCVKLAKGDFLGREALAHVKQAGTSRRLSTVCVGGEAYLPLFGGEAVTMEGEIIGRLRSAGYGFTLRRNIAYTYLPIGRAQPGSKINVEVFAEQVAGEVMPDVLYDPKGEHLTS